MKKTAIQQAIIIVKSRIELIDETLMGKHTAHHLQQVERELWNLLKEEKQQIKEAFQTGDFENTKVYNAEQYYQETYEANE